VRIAVRAKYQRFRANGFTVEDSGRNARILDAFEDAESDEKVRINAEPEQENYFDVYGEPEGYIGANGRRVSDEQERKEMEETLERDGAWYVFSEYRCPCCETWLTADGVGMNTGYSDPTSPFENCYVPDLMAAALEHVEEFCVKCARHHKLAV
jgi:hypothetical protein